ncbi:MAG: hypothetical protein ABH870_04615 [bacterium]
MMNKKQILFSLFILIFLWGMIGCKPINLSVSGQIVDKNTGNGISGLTLTLEIVDKEIEEEKESVIKSMTLTTGNEGKFETLIISVPEKALKSKDMYKLKITLPKEFCYPSVTYENLPSLDNPQLKKIVVYGAEIKGRVINKKDRKSLPGVEVLLTEILNEGKDNKYADSKKTSGQGDFNFTCVDAKKIILKFSHKYYWEKPLKISSLAPGNTKDLKEIELERIDPNTDKDDEISPVIFYIPKECAKDLNKETLTDTLKKIFNESKNPLTEKARVMMIENNKEWKIMDGEFDYILEDQGEEISCRKKSLFPNPI